MMARVLAGVPLPPIVALGLPRACAVRLVTFRVVIASAETLVMGLPRARAVRLAMFRMVLE